MSIKQYGMPTLIEQETLEETMALARELRLDFVELNMNMPAYTIEKLEDIVYLNRLHEEYKIGYAIHLDENMNVCDFNKAVSAAYLDTVKRTIMVAKKIQAPIINMHLNHGIFITLPDRKVWLFQKYTNQYMESWKSFRTMCEKTIGDADIHICIENTNGYTEFELKAIEYLLESPVFALTWDIGHSHVVSDTDVDFILKHNSRLIHMHIHDGLGSHNHMTLGTGEIHLNERLLTADMCNARCVVETKTIEALRKSIAWLKENHYKP